MKTGLHQRFCTGKANLSKAIGFLTLTIFCFLNSGFADIILVPSDHVTIQGAIDAASDGDEIIVSQGTYVENINFNGENITLRSEDPLSSPVVQNTIIDGNGAGSVVTFSGSEGSTCTLSGFSITGGKAALGGGINGQGTLATIVYNHIFDNETTGNYPSGLGGGIYKCDGIIENNRIYYNYAEDMGGGISSSNGVIQNNMIGRNIAGGEDNFYSGDGAGLVFCSGIISNNCIVGNLATHSSGGGIFYCEDAEIYNNLLVYNYAFGGSGAMGHSGAVVQNNIIYNNKSSHGYGGITGIEGEIRNCIIWENQSGSENQIGFISEPSYCCIQNWDEGGTGNINTDPLFSDPSKIDFHLKDASPCIDAGDPVASLEDACIPPGKGDTRGDMGIYGGPFNCSELDIDIPPMRLFPGPIYVPKDFRSVQMAIDMAMEGAEIIVSPGTYHENLRFNGKNLILKSTDPGNQDVVSQTIIRGSSSSTPTILFAGTENSSIVNGLTISHGSGIMGNGASVTIKNCIIEEGWSSADTGIREVNGWIENNIIRNNYLVGDNGAGMSDCSGTFINNIFRDNRCVNGTVYNCHGTFTRNIIESNTTSDTGGAFASCTGYFIDNTINANEAGNNGGGFHDCEGTFQDNIVKDNLAGLDGGGFSECHGDFLNNIIYGNEAADSGGGLSECSGRFYNNSVTRNDAQYGSGVYQFNGPIVNSIIWGNLQRYHSREQIVQDDEYTTPPIYCCIESVINIGDSNIYKPPLFTDPENGDFHLLPESPCIDAGKALTEVSEDFEGEPRPYNGALEPRGDGSDFDIGADEITGVSPEPTPIPTPSPTPSDIPGRINVPGDYGTIQEAIDASQDGDEIVVYPAVYREQIQMKNRNVLLRSTEPTSPAVVSNTVINGELKGAVVTFKGTETTSCVITGFKITMGSGYNGGGISGNGAMAAIRHNIITNNYAKMNGGGISYLDGGIENNLISFNKCSHMGGGLAYCNGDILNNRVFRNDPAMEGALAGCGGEIRNNEISENKNDGLYACGSIIHNDIHDNEGDGISTSHGPVEGNIITGNMGGINYAEDYVKNNLIFNNRGNGLLKCHVPIINNTIWGNHAEEGAGGISASKGTIINCIIWNNTSDDTSAQISGSEMPTFSCVQDWPPFGTNMISDDPMLKDPENGDFHLLPESPCIDAGSIYPGLLFDYENDERPYDGTAAKRGDGSNIDMGADEFTGVPHPTPTPTPSPTPSGIPGRINVPGDYDTIQEAVDAAEEGNEIVAYPATYKENVRIKGKNVTLRSSDPTSSGLVQKTVINGNYLGPVITFDGTEASSCVLSGFTIINGNNNSGGGIRGKGASASIINNRIVYNHALEDGAGIHDLDGLIQDNIIEFNRGEGSGSALAGCDGDIRHNLIRENNSIVVFQCNGAITANVISKNAGGPALYDCNGPICSNLVADNDAGEQSSVMECDGLFMNNTIVNNVSSKTFGGLKRCQGFIVNCILWGNRPAFSGKQFYYCSYPIFSNVEDWPETAGGNISLDPGFVNPSEGNYHLRPDSPCIDAGNIYYQNRKYIKDIDGMCRFAGAGVDMGCHEYGSGVDTDGDMLTDLDENGTGSDPAVLDTDGDGLSDFAEVKRGTLPDVPDSPEGLNVPVDFDTIQEALFVSLKDETVTVSPGTYRENLLLPEFNIILQGSAAPDKNSEARPVVDGGNVMSAVSGGGAKAANTIVRNLVLTYGKAMSGAGIRNVYGVIENCVIRYGDAYENGGGMAYCSGRFEDNEISHNEADDYGGGVFGCHGLFINSNISENMSQSGWGGGVAGGSGEFRRCIISRNRGSGFHDFDGLVLNCGIFKNKWALENCDGVIFNCSIADNEKGVSDCSAEIINSIIWGNQLYQLNNTFRPAFCCIQDWDGTGTGNISTNPQFADPENDDYHLASNSPCIDSGQTGLLLFDYIADIDGEGRVANREVDIGYDEYGSSIDSDNDLLSDNDEGVYGSDPNIRDTDGDGLNDGPEVIRGTDPVIADSPAGLVIPDNFQTIQKGVFLAFPGETVTVRPGTWLENLKMTGREIVLQGLDPDDDGTVSSTVIDGGNMHPVITLHGTETEVSMIAGLTIQSGKEGVLGNGNFAHIQKNIITRNTVGLNECNGTINENFIHYNHTGLIGCDGIIERNIIERSYKKGLWKCDALISKNKIRHNNEGGLHDCQGTIEGNLISDNRSHEGAGILQCNGLIRNNVIRDNFAYQGFREEGGHVETWGGGLSRCSGTIINNVIAGNVASAEAQCGTTWPYYYFHGSATALGGGLYGCDGVIENNIIVNNNADAYVYSVDGSNCGWSSEKGDGLFNCTGEISYCNIPVGHVEGSSPLRNCISADPMFADYSGGDFHLQDGSPCIDAGDPAEEYNDGCIPPGKGGVRCDMGVYGGSWNCNFPVDPGIIMDFILNKESLTPGEMDRYDVNGDGIIDVADVVLALKEANIR
mgnify:CR=1 FL=1